MISAIGAVNTDQRKIDCTRSKAADSEIPYTAVDALFALMAKTRATAGRRKLNVIQTGFPPMAA